MHYILHRLIAQRFSGAQYQSKARDYDLKMNERIERIYCWLITRGFNAPLPQQRPTPRLCCEGKFYYQQFTYAV